MLKTKHEKGWWLPFSLLFPLLAHLSLGLRFPRIIHGDETWTINIVLLKPWAQVTSTILSYDNHPPLYYYLSKVWISIFGNSVYYLRWLSFLFSVVTICALIWLFRSKRISEKAIALVLLGTNPLLTYYSGTVRPYSLLVMLASIMTITAFRLKRPEQLKFSTAESGEARDSLADSQRFYWVILYYLSAFFLGITHYFGTLYVWVVTCGDFIARRIEKNPWRGLILLIMISIWPVAQVLLGSVGEQTKSNAWIHVLFLISTVNNFFAGTFPLLMISKSIPQSTFAVILALLLVLVVIRPAVKDYWIRCLDSPKKLHFLLAPDAVFWSVVCAVVLLIGSFLDSVLPFTTPYYFLVCLPAVSLLLAKIFSISMRDRFTTALSSLLVMAIAFLQILMSYQRLASP